MAESPFASFIHANFRNAKFCDANIYSSIFTDADFYEADLSGANLGESNFAGANLGKVIVNDKTITDRIRLASKEQSYNISKRKRHWKIDENLRRIVMR